MVLILLSLLCNHDNLILKLDQEKSIKAILPDYLFVSCDYEINKELSELS